MLDLFNHYWPAVIVVVETILSYTPDNWKAKGIVQLSFKALKAMLAAISASKSK